ncbi:MAG: transposase [Microscillaceae bacterium]|nr:transposase [Microscillaceae bacterium]MDW8461606.1 transposase [Cytophagales bacterium]
MLSGKNIKPTPKVRKNMKPEELSEEEKYSLYKRGVMEAVMDKLKNRCQIAYTRIEVLGTL